MVEIVDKVTINCTPQKVFDTLIFFFQSTENYKLWHKDHISCYWKKGKNFSPDSVLIAEELLHGTPHKLGFKIINIEQYSLLDYKMLFPFSLLCSGGSFKMIAAGEETELTARLNFRFGFILKILFNRIIVSLRIHMKEEGIAIKEFIEKIPEKSQS